MRCKMKAMIMDMCVWPHKAQSFLIFGDVVQAEGFAPVEILCERGCCSLKADTAACSASADGIRSPYYIHKAGGAINRLRFVVAAVDLAVLLGWQADKSRKWRLTKSPGAKLPASTGGIPLANPTWQ